VLLGFVMSVVDTESLVDLELGAAVGLEFNTSAGRNAPVGPPPPGEEDRLCVWPDGTQCYRDELDEYLKFMSDDYEILCL